ncbi:MAG: hypothetical protein Q7S04_00870 [Candidatus Moranbacteria bacterium]|nr:hypothetical protein [Candidatus Moranbacteria bacterium]
MRTLLMLIVVALLSACATLGGNTMNLAAEDGKKQAVSIDPIAFTGVQMTPAIQSGKYKAYLASFPEEFFSEFHPLRFRYNAIAYGKDSGKEYPAQAIYAGYAQCALRLVLIVEGDVNEPIVGAFVTTRFTRVFNLHGEEISVKTPEKLISDAKYRKEVVLSGGTLTSKLKGIPVLGKSGMQETFASWNTVRVPALAYEIRTPLSERLVKTVARENPELNFSEKLVGNGRFGISLSWFGIAAGAVADVFTAANAPSKGWDEQSELKRGQQGMIARVIKAQYDGAIRAGMTCTASDIRRAGY